MVSNILSHRIERTWNIQLSYTSDDLQMIRGNWNADLFFSGSVQTQLDGILRKLGNRPSMKRLWNLNYAQIHGSRRSRLPNQVAGGHPNGDALKARRS